MVCAVNCAQSCHIRKGFWALRWLILHINLTLVASFYLFGRFISLDWSLTAGEARTDVTDCNGSYPYCFSDIAHQCKILVCFSLWQTSYNNVFSNFFLKQPLNTKIAPQLIILHVGNGSMHDIKSAMLTIIQKWAWECWKCESDVMQQLWMFF